MENCKGCESLQPQINRLRESIEQLKSSHKVRITLTDWFHYSPELPMLWHNGIPILIWNNDADIITKYFLDNRWVRIPLKLAIKELEKLWIDFEWRICKWWRDTKEAVFMDLWDKTKNTTRYKILYAKNHIVKFKEHKLWICQCKLTEVLNKNY